jgi:hypothetical protein
LENVSIPEELPVTSHLQDSDVPFNTEEPEEPLPTILSRALEGDVIPRRLNPCTVYSRYCQDFIE